MNANVLLLLAGCGFIFILPAFGPAAAVEAPALSDSVFSDDVYPTSIRSERSLLPAA
jgi:hypothetical protein